MKKILFFLVGAMLFLESCGLPIGLPEEYRYAGELSKNDLVGIWVLDAASVGKLGQGGAHYYLRQTDHVIVLNDDGTCVVRGFSSGPPFPSFDMSEKEAYTRGALDPSNAVTAVLKKYERCYEWKTNDIPVISGPFPLPDSTMENSSLLSKFTVWYFDDWGKRVSRPEAESIRTRYNVDVAFFTGHENDRSSSMSFYVGKDDGGYFLWKMGPLRSYAVPENTLVYRCVTMDELQKMVQTGK